MEQAAGGIRNWDIPPYGQSINHNSADNVKRRGRRGLSAVPNKSGDAALSPAAGVTLPPVSAVAIAGAGRDDPVTDTGCGPRQMAIRTI
jgi:hypothetical protein